MLIPGADPTGRKARRSLGTDSADDLRAEAPVPPEYIEIPAKMARCWSPCATRSPHAVDRFGIRPDSGRTILACGVWADGPGGPDRGTTQLDADASRAISGAIGEPVRVHCPEGNGEAPAAARSRLP